MNNVKTPTFLLALFLSSQLLADILSVHCPSGCPESSTGNDLVFGHLYALSNNPTTKFADWVAYEVDVVNFGDSPGRNWASEPLLDKTQTLEEDDYRGANSELKVDRGHQAPLASFAGSRYWSELNYLSNITPQKGPLNQGAWQRLEQAIRDGSKFRDSLFVITGTIYDDDESPLPQADEVHKIPNAYYKIIYNDKGDYVAFIMDQDTERNTEHCSTRATLQQISERINYTLPSLKSSTAMINRVGC